MRQRGLFDCMKVCFTGDFCLAGKDIRTALLSTLIDPWSGLCSAFHEGISIITNAECALTHEPYGLRFKWANLKASPDLHWMLDGLAMAVLGNNHIPDFGDRGVRDTQQLLSRKGISYVGYGEAHDDALRPAFLDLGGNRLGVVSLCCPTTNGENLATHLTPGVAPLGMATLKQAVEGARSHCEALVGYLHWGCEWIHDPVPDQLRMARHAIECGADAVIGCHSHTIQSSDQYRGRWIFYGLGNYLFRAGNAQALRDNGEIEDIPLTLTPPNREALAVSFTIIPDTGAGRLSLDRVQPMRFDDDWEPRPIAISDLTFDLESANRRLHAYASRHEAALRDRSETVFKALLLNGSALAYWYSDETIGNQKRGLMDVFKYPSNKIIKRVLSLLK